MKMTKKVRVEGASVLMHVNFPSVLHPQLLTKDTMKSKSLFEPNMCFYSHELILLLYLSFYPKFIYILSFVSSLIALQCPKSRPKKYNDIMHLKLRIL